MKRKRKNYASKASKGRGAGDSRKRSTVRVTARKWRNQKKKKRKIRRCTIVTAEQGIGKKVTIIDDTVEWMVDREVVSRAKVNAELVGIKFKDSVMRI